VTLSPGASGLPARHSWHTRRDSPTLRPELPVHSQRRSAVSIVAGADACRGGWIAIVLDDGRVAESLLAPTFTWLLGELDAAAAIAVDILIGLPSEGVRAADVAARAFVRPAAQ
jgi:hypothetical protein